jgi:hypothetical protein
LFPEFAQAERCLVDARSCSQLRSEAGNRRLKIILTECPIKAAQQSMMAAASSGEASNVFVP